MSAILSRRSQIFFLSAIVLAAAGLGLILFMTAPWGIGLSPDSIGYLVAARSLVLGQGMLDIPGSAGEVVAFTRHGPVITWMIAAVAGLSHAPVEQAARWIHGGLFSANILFAFSVIYRYTRDYRSAWLAGSLALFSVVLIEIHSSVLSEPVFLLLGMAGLYFLSMALGSGLSAFNVLPTALILALAFLTRYAGISLIMTAGLCICIWGGGSFLRRLALAMLTSVVSSLLMVLWVGRNHALSHGPGFPGAMFEPYFGVSFWELGACSSIWILPEPVAPAIRALFLTAGIALAAWGIVTTAQADFKQDKAGDAQPDDVLRYYPWVLLVFVFCHLAVHILAASFLDRDDLNNRHLSPVYMALLLFFVMTGWRLGCAQGITRWRKTLMSCSAVFFMIISPVRAGWDVVEARRHGIGYAAPQWIQSELLRQVRALPQDIPVYSNGMDILYWFAGRPIRPIPDRLWREAKDKRSGPINPRALAAMAESMRSQGAVIAYFRSIYWRWYYPPFESFEKELPLDVIKQTSDGILAGLRKGE